MTAPDMDAPQSRASQKARYETAKSHSGKADVLDVSLRIRSGGFESRISVPLDASEADKRSFVAAWMQMMMETLKFGSGKVEQQS